MISICIDSHAASTGALYTRRVFDNPEQCVVVNLDRDTVAYTYGFEYHSPGTIQLRGYSFLFLYRFTDRGMLLGYVANVTGSGYNLPLSDGIYYHMSTWNFDSYQKKFYVQCMSHDLYNNNNLLYEFDYLNSTNEDVLSRITKLDQLSALQLKSFGGQSTSSLVLLPYTFFNTSKFDFLHTMYKSDGSLNDNAVYQPTMFVDGGSLQDRYYPQPTVVPTS